MSGKSRIARFFTRADAPTDESASTTMIAGGVLVRGTSGRTADLPDVVTALSRLDPAGAASLIVVAPKTKLGETSRRRLSALGSRVRVIVFGGSGDEGDRTFPRLDDRYALRDLIAEHWDSSARPALGIAGEVRFDLAWAIDDVLGTDTVLQASGTPRRSMKVTAHDATYDLISGAGAAVRGAETPRADLIVPSTVAGMGVIHVGTAAFAGHPLIGASFGAPLRGIGDRAFSGCEDLTSLCLPGSLDRIGVEAFAGCISLSAVRLPRGLRTIGDRAFQGCSALELAVIPASVVTIGDRAFDGCAPSLRFVVEEGSAAHRWVRDTAFEHDAVEPRVAAARPARLEPIHSGGVEYDVLPGGALEVRAVSPAAGAGHLDIPEAVAGQPVRGLGYEAVHAAAGPVSLRLPESLRWISPYAVAQDASVQEVSGASGVQARGRRSLPAKSSVRTRGVLDADSVRLTLRMVCARLDIDVPEHLDAGADIPFSNLAAGVLSSSAGSLFFGSFRGERQANVDTLVRRGVSMFLSDREVRTSSGELLPHVIHPAPWRAFESLCSWFAEQYSARTIAVTGSVGKTSTKEMLQGVCATALDTLHSTGNQNGVAQVGRYIQKLTTGTQVYIQETGAAKPGAVESAARMLHPDAFLITNIGVNHIGNYGGVQDNILKDKASHDRYLPPDGVAFLNFDDPKLRSLELTHRVISYAIDDTEADYFAEDVVESDGRLTFTMVESGTRRRVKAAVEAFGRHNVGNAVVAFAVGRWLGIPIEKIVEGIGAYRGEGLRQNLAEIGGRRVLVDCYNASEIAMMSTADTVQRISVPEGGRRVLVFADIDDKLGDITEEVHRRVGRRLVEERGIDLFVCFGAHAAWTAEELREGGREVFETTDREELHRYLQAELREEDLPAFKGGQQMALSITIDALFGTSFVLIDGDTLVRRGTDLVRDGVRYREIREFGIEARGFDGEPSTELRVPAEIDGVPVFMIGKGAFSRSAVTSIRLSAPMRTLAPSAFFQSRDLREVELPETLRVIGRSAFNGCASLREVDIPEGVTTISARAFYRCESLQRVSIPASVRTIEEQVFSYSPSVVIVCPAGSYADTFCREHWPTRVIENI